MPVVPEGAGPGIRWCDGRLELLDQRLLPAESRYVACSKAREVADAIRGMIVRGAPAIAIAAGYGMALAARQHDNLTGVARSEALQADRAALAMARPTAVNLVHTLARFEPLIAAAAPIAEFAALAASIHDEDIIVNRRLAELGASLIAPGARVLTHCNTGMLATGGVGTAFGVIVAAWRAGKLASVSFTETRPWLQGARLNAWEFARVGLPATLMSEAAAADLARRGEVDWLVVGADRIAANGDVGNKIGTAPLAMLTRLGGGRVMVVAPFATVDLTLADGSTLVIEQRDAYELWRSANAGSIPENITVVNPVFDVTPAAGVDRLVTERGVISPAQGEFPTGLSDSVHDKIKR